MKKIIFPSIFLIAICGYLGLSSKTIDDKTKQKSSNETIDSIAIKEISSIEKLYHEINLEGILKYEVFEQGMQGYENLYASLKNKNIITLIDFSLPSTDKRMYIIDVKNKKLLFHNIVSHGRNSGEKFANSFSNKHGSFQSSLGFYTTDNTYFGGNGYSLVLNGLEPGINDQAKPRAVVIHGADYCSYDIIKKTGRLGRSYGCPALPRELNKPIINTIKNGSMLYIYAENQNYLAQSKILKNNRTMIAQNENLNTTDSVNIL